MHVYAENVLNKIESLVNHVNNQNQLGRTMRWIINFTQMLCGTFTPLLECNKEITHSATQLVLDNTGLYN
jgi:hypothetical protein